LIENSGCIHKSGSRNFLAKLKKVARWFWLENKSGNENIKWQPVWNMTYLREGETKQRVQKHFELLANYLKNNNIIPFYQF